VRLATEHDLVCEFVIGAEGLHLTPSRSPQHKRATRVAKRARSAAVARVGQGVLDRSFPQKSSSRTTIRRRSEDAESVVPARSGRADAPLREGRRPPRAACRTAPTSRRSAVIISGWRSRGRRRSSRDRTFRTKVGTTPRPFPRSRRGRRGARFRGKRRRTAERDVIARAQPLHVAPHVAALHRIDVERGVVPTLRAEDGTQQDGRHATTTPAAFRQVLDPRGAEVGIRCSRNSNQKSYRRRHMLGVCRPRQPIQTTRPVGC
jgi:hypothetical protein